MIGTDLFQIDDDQYLITADYYTKFPLVDKLPKPATSETVVSILKDHCSIMGIPDVIRSDNGPHYSSQIFTKFTSEWGIKHITSSPRYPRSNGFIERQVGLVKSVMKKAKEAREDVQLALLRLRTTPISCRLPSPAEMLFQRRVRDTLPSKIRNSDPLQEDIRQELTSRQIEQKDYHDKSVKELPPLIPGQRALYQDLQSGRWAPATVVTRAPEPRSYVIRTDNGQTMRRNRVQLRGRILSTTGPPPTPPRREVAQPSIVPYPPASVTNPPVPVGNGVSTSEGQTCKDNAPVTVSSPKPTTIVLRSGREVRRPARYSD